jgi:Protein of unknown function (DUF3179)
VYAAEIDGKTYTFEASGSLWKDALVLMDRQTSSLWSQISGEAIDGSMDGTVLELFPSEFMIFSAVVSKYPQAQFLKKAPKSDKGSHYKDYFADSTRIGIFGRTFESEELRSKAIALGLRVGREAVALPLDEVEKAAAAKVEFMDKVAVVFYDPASQDAFAYSTSADNARKGKLTVEINGEVKFNGKTISPAEFRAGREGFEPMPVITTFWFAWKSFFPHTTVGRFWPNG